MKKRILVFLTVALVAVSFGGWKWSGGSGHKEAGWTWDESALSWDWDGADDGLPGDAPAG